MLRAGCSEDLSQQGLGGGGVQVQMGWGKQFGQLVQKLRGGSVLSELREQQG